jgi:hypothetical protein
MSPRTRYDVELSRTLDIGTTISYGSDHSKHTVRLE